MIYNRIRNKKGDQARTKAAKWHFYYYSTDITGGRIIMVANMPIVALDPILNG